MTDKNRVNCIMAGSKRIRILHMLYNPERQNVFFGELQLQDTENGGVSGARALACSGMAGMRAAGRQREQVSL